MEKKDKKPKARQGDRVVRSPHLMVVSLSRKIAAALENASAKLQRIAAVAASGLVCGRGRRIPIASMMTEQITHTEIITRWAPNAGRYLRRPPASETGHIRLGTTPRCQQLAWTRNR